MLTQLCARTALFALSVLPTLALAGPPSGPGGMRFVLEKPNAPWTAGSKQKVTVAGPATHGALGIRYRWMDEKSTLLLAGFIRKNSTNDWSDEVLVPMYSAKGRPRLIIEVAKGQGKTWIFRSGKEFNLPPIKGLVIDNVPPQIADRIFNENKMGHFVEVEVKDASGISEALLVMGSSKDSELLKGACKTIGAKTTCLYYLPKNPKGLALTAQITDLAGNRTIASIQSGGKK